MQKQVYILVITVLFFINNKAIIAQCVNSNNVYAFEYEGKTYEVVKENKTWLEAAACAIERGGKLAEINDANEQNKIQTELISNAGITPSNTVAPDGGGGAYVWLGGNDIASEGTWVWDGDNSNNGSPFWNGLGMNGSAVEGSYENWGSPCPPCPNFEPDNFSDNQNGLGISLNGWPLGQSGQWNDIDHTNALYYIIEYSTITSLSKTEKNEGIEVFPNPAAKSITVSGLLAQSTVVLSNINGKEIISLETTSNRTVINVSSLPKGIYFIRVWNDSNPSPIIKKLVIN